MSLHQISIDEISQSSIYACFNEDYWNESNSTEEMKIRGMAQRVDGYVMNSSNMLYWIGYVLDIINTKESIENKKRWQ